MCSPFNKKETGITWAGLKNVQDSVVVQKCTSNSYNKNRF